MSNVHLLHLSLSSFTDLNIKREMTLVFRHNLLQVGKKKVKLYIVNESLGYLLYLVFMCLRSVDISLRFRIQKMLNIIRWMTVVRV